MLHWHYVVLLMPVFINLLMELFILKYLFKHANNVLRKAKLFLMTNSHIKK